MLERLRILYGKCGSRECRMTDQVLVEPFQPDWARHAYPSVIPAKAGIQRWSLRNGWTPACAEVMREHASSQPETTLACITVKIGRLYAAHRRALH
jgi:hypothetical protein